MKKPVTRTGSLIGTPGRIRTADFLFRRQTLYPAELRARDHHFNRLAALWYNQNMHKSQEELAAELNNARIEFPVGEYYVHYKNLDLYKIIGHTILEETEEIAINYEAQYGEFLPFTRSVKEWQKPVEGQEQEINRFTRVMPKEEFGTPGGI